MEKSLISNGKVVRWAPTGVLGIVKRAGSRSSKVEFHISTGARVIRQVSNRQLTRKAARK